MTLKNKIDFKGVYDVRVFQCSSNSSLVSKQTMQRKEKDERTCQGIQEYLQFVYFKQRVNKEE